MPVSSLLAAPIDLNGPGHYFHWSIFMVSEANLVLIAVMVVIFGAALIIPFPGHRRQRAAALGAHNGHSGAHDGSGAASPSGAVQPAGAQPDGASTGNGASPPAAGSSSLATSDLGDDGDARMWTARVRRRALKMLPPGKLLPDRQPAYVASWVYVFGVATLAALGLVIVSGFAIALGGTDWWHTNPVGHFFNSLHMWSVEAFMAFMVIHLWGKFWMAAWRGRRALTWMTGIVAFLASVVECFTGYLSQQNFDSQWISTNGKDAINSTGLGAFFNLLNFGQMLLWHVVLIPIILIALVGAHVLAVRVRGVSHPLPERRARGFAARRAAAASDAAEWRGPTRRYDILKEGTIAALVALILVVALASLLSSPDEPPVTIRTWARLAPADFLATAGNELAGTSETADYGPPYNNGNSNVQGLGISWQSLAGVHERIDSAATFVLDPLSKTAPTNPTLAAALAEYNGATSKVQDGWTQAYLKAVTKVSFTNGSVVLPQGNYGPVATMLSTELSLARNGSLDAGLISNQEFYGTNFTKPLLFLEDGEYFAAQAQAQHLTGSQWGVMNETGSYPGQPWLWLYTLWYQVPGLNSSANIDLIAIYLTGAATLLLLATPFIPGLRDIPRFIPLHKLIWRDWYKRSKYETVAGPQAPAPAPAAPGEVAAPPAPAKS